MKKNLLFGEIILIAVAKSGCSFVEFSGHVVEDLRSESRHSNLFSFCWEKRLALEKENDALEGDLLV